MQFHYILDKMFGLENIPKRFVLCGMMFSGLVTNYMLRNKNITNFPKGSVSISSSDPPFQRWPPDSQRFSKKLCLILNDLDINVYSFEN